MSPRTKLLSLVILTFALLAIASTSAQAQSADERTARPESQRMHRSTTDESKPEQQVARQNLCQKRQKNISNILDRVAKRGDRQLEVFDKISSRVDEFYTKKNLAVPNYDELVDQVNSKKSAATSAVNTVQTSSQVFDCNSDDPRYQIETFRQSAQTMRSSLKQYKTAVKDLIVAIKTSLSKAEN